jgi:hypothetical protein
MVYAPIWKDTFYTASTASVNYKITDTGGNVLFLGKAVKFPGAATLEININQICRNFMNNDLPDFRGVTTSTSYTNSNACKTFNLYTGDSTTTAQSYTFLWDWSYTDWTGGTKSMSSPVNGHNNGTMLTFSSQVSGNTVRNSISFSNNGYCGDAALYYQNKLGGWDSFLIEGNVKRTDSITQYKYSKAVKNTSIDFEDTVYTDDISRRWQMYTGWMSDAEASRFADNVLQSTRVYLHLFGSNEIIPVVVTDSTAEHKTFNNQGRKKFNYVINVKASQTNIRR